MHHCTQLLRLTTTLFYVIPDRQVHGSNMGPTLEWQGPGGPQVGHVDLAIWDVLCKFSNLIKFLDSLKDLCNRVIFFDSLDLFCKINDFKSPWFFSSVNVIQTQMFSICDCM